MREALIGQNSCTGMHTGLETEWFITLSRLIKCRKYQERRTTMYKILIKYDNDKFNLWMPYGSTTTSTTGKSEFTEFETDDVTVLKETILKLDKEHGFEKIRVVEDVTVNFTVDVVVDENTESTEGTTNDTPSGDNTGE